MTLEDTSLTQRPEGCGSGWTPKPLALGYFFKDFYLAERFEEVLSNPDLNPRLGQVSNSIHLRFSTRSLIALGVVGFVTWALQRPPCWGDM